MKPKSMPLKSFPSGDGAAGRQTTTEHGHFQTVLWMCRTTRADCVRRKQGGFSKASIF